MAGNVKNMGLTSLDDLFKSEQERQQDTHERILNIPVGEIYPYARQPYSIKRPTPDLVRLMDSIEQVGVAEPLIVRPRTEGGYEIISGHRRDYCARTVGLESLPVIVREYTDDEADILVVDYNITREDLLPSEKARAYTGALTVLALSLCTVPAMAAGTDPLSIVNSLSDFIFNIIKAIGVIILGWGVVQVGMSIQSHDASQRTQGFLCLFGGLMIAFAKEILTTIGAI